MTIRYILGSIRRSAVALYRRIFTNHSIFYRKVMQLNYQKRLKQYRNIHQGERCFILGNGPSLKAADLDKLTGEYTFASNRIFHIFSKTNWRPTYYALHDLNVFDECAPQFPRLIRETKALFLVNYARPLCERTIKRSKDVQFFHVRITGKHTNRNFSNNIAKIIFGGRTITYSMLQIAVYMGFTEIYLLGVDHNYPLQCITEGTISGDDVKNCYFEGTPDKVSVSAPDLDTVTAYLQVAKVYADAYGIIIKNATRGGKLEVFDRVAFDTLIQKA